MLRRSSVDFSERSAPHSDRPLQRLNWGCGAHTAVGWINSDLKGDGGVDLVADIRQGLPLGSGCIDYAVSVHALPEFGYAELDRVLGELLRVLKPGGVLRLALPDLQNGIDAYMRGDRDYFQVDPKAASSLGGRFILHMLWYGYSRTLFMPDFAAELLEKAGFVDVHECPFRVTKSEFAEIVALDNRPQESFFIEARRPYGDPGPPADPYNRRVPDGPPVRILEMTHADADEKVRGHFRVEQVDARLELIGWAVGIDLPVAQVEVVSDGDVVARTPPVAERPDIGAAFPDVAGAATSGFQLTIEPSGAGVSRLEVQVALADGAAVPLGELQVETARRRRKGLFRRGG
jgi:SAM-dependent methyltransferase